MSKSSVEHDSATPAHGQQVITAVAFIYKNEDGTNKVMLAKRADTKAFLPGLFEMVGGHIDYGEDIKVGLRREIQEEMGVGVSLGDPFACFTYLNKIKGSHSVETVYFAQLTDPEENISIHPEDHSEIRWFTEQEVLDNKVLLAAPPDSDSMDNTLDEDTEDPEYAAILKGFRLLAGDSLDTGNSSAS